MDDVKVLVQAIADATGVPVRYFEGPTSGEAMEEWDRARRERYEAHLAAQDPFFEYIKARLSHG